MYSTQIKYSITKIFGRAGAVGPRGSRAQERVKRTQVRARVLKYDLPIILVVVSSSKKATHLHVLSTGSLPVGLLPGPPRSIAPRSTSRWLRCTGQAPVFNAAVWLSWHAWWHCAGVLYFSGLFCVRKESFCGQRGLQKTKIDTAKG